MSDDIELTLALSPRQLARLRNHALLRAHARRGGGRSTLVRTYFDTPKLGLRERRLSLGLDQPAGAPDLSRLRDPLLRDALGRDGLGKALAPVFTTEVERSRVPLQIDGSVIELAFDVGRIRSQDRQEPICQAQLQLVAGRPEQLYELALKLHQSVPFRLEHRDAVRRGYDLAVERGPTTARAAETRLHEGLSVGAAFAALARAGLGHLTANEDAVFAGDDPEAVHQMRVAVRRLRALIAAFRRALDAEAVDFLKAELGWLQRQLGPARDWDVFLDATVAALVRRLPEEPSLPVLRDAAQDARRRAYDQAHAALGDRRYTRLLLRFQLWLDAGRWDGPTAAEALAQPVVPFAAKVLDHRLKSLTRFGARDDLPEHELHALRIRAKKLRYAAEFFRSLYKGKGARKYVKALAELQDTLGSLNDALVGRTLLAPLLTASAETEAGPPIQRAGGIVAGFQAARIADDLRRFRDLWPTFVAREPFWS